MFERYTEKARRVVFFARYEASQFGSPMIDTEHLLLGLMREEMLIYTRWLPRALPPLVLQRIEREHPRRQPTPTTVDLPLSNASKRVLAHATEEADRLNSKPIGPEHLLLGLLHEEDCKATKLLCELGADINKLRIRFELDAQAEAQAAASRSVRSANTETIQIHGVAWNADYIGEVVKRYRRYNWHWRKTAWTPRDMVVERKTGKISFDMTLATDTANFELIKGGWKKDHCLVCRWELFESSDLLDHTAGYTNGRDWLCEECYEKFWQRPDFISSRYSDLT